MSIFFGDDTSLVLRNLVVSEVKAAHKICLDLHLLFKIEDEDPINYFNKEYYSTSPPSRHFYHDTENKVVLTNNRYRRRVVKIKPQISKKVIYILLRRILPLELIIEFIWPTYYEQNTDIEKYLSDFIVR